VGLGLPHLVPAGHPEPEGQAAVGQEGASAGEEGDQTVNDDTKTWECPECGQLYLTPDTIYQAVCSCPTLTMPVPFALMTGPPPMMRTVNMVDVTNGRPSIPGEWVLRAVPDRAAGLW
jgi:hypothetical protein